MPKVTETGRLVFLVQSSTKTEEQRTVDLAKYEGSGECDCFFFKRQIRPILEQHISQSSFKPFGYQPEDRHQCLHIRAAKDYLINKVIQGIRKQWSDHNQPT